MIDLGPAIARAVRAEWSDERAHAAAAGIRLRRRRRAVTRAALGTIAALVVIGGGAWTLWPHASPAPAPAALATHTPSPPPSPAAVPSTTLRFDDGSTASPIGRDGELRLASVQPGRVVVELVAGAGSFHVVPDRARLFRATSGAVRVESFGATFSCARTDQRAEVVVVEGSVRVFWDDQQRELSAGERGVFPPAPSPSLAPPALAPPAPVEPAHRAPRPAHARADDQDTWRDLARDGDYDQAYAALTRPDAPAVRDEADELLLAADVARLSHHPAEAVSPLRRILRDHAADPRASLAAFTLGRVLLEELGRPGEAAAAFAQADALAPDGPLAEDAVAREVEARSRGGDASGAERLAREYLRRFPDGRKVRSVKRFGGLE